MSPGGIDRQAARQACAVRQLMVRRRLDLVRICQLSANRLSSQFARLKTDSRVCAVNVRFRGCSQSRHRVVAICNVSLTNGIRSGRRSIGQENHPTHEEGSPMFTRSKICTALLAAMVGNAWAQNADTDSTASSVSRSPALRSAASKSEGALPITVISRDAIDKIGALVGHRPDPEAAGDDRRQLPGSPRARSTATASATSTAAIHGLDEKYTLVLLNGRRVAPFGGFGSSGGAMVP